MTRLTAHGARTVTTRLTAWSALLRVTAIALCVAPVSVLPAVAAQAQGPVVRNAAIGVVRSEPVASPTPYHYATLGLNRADAWKLSWVAAVALAVSTADRRGDAWARHPGVQNDGTLDALSRLGDKDGTIVAPAVGPALWLWGRARGDSGTAVMGLRTTEAVFLGGATVTAIKMLAGRTRPFASADHSPTHWDLFGGFRGDSTRSFASGHTTVVTAAAVTLAAEWRRQGLRGWKTLGPPTVYTLAAITGASRVRDRNHWMSDVVSGAAVGMLSALVVRRWHDAHPHSRIDRLFLAH
jgi:membrane-associated phospholipid phosphatase